jgi:hypothetical protein
MQRIQDGRRDITIHGNASVYDLPVSGLSGEELAVAGTEPFVPANMDEPKIYPGDVIVGVSGGEITYAELIYDKMDDGVLVTPLDSGNVEFIADSLFAKRFYQAEETHIYDDITRNTVEWDVEFDESAIERPDVSRER